MHLLIASSSRLEWPWQLLYWGYGCNWGAFNWFYCDSRPNVGAGHHSVVTSSAHSFSVRTWLPVLTCWVTKSKLNRSRATFSPPSLQLFLSQHAIALTSFLLYHFQHHNNNLACANPSTLLPFSPNEELLKPSAGRYQLYSQNSSACLPIGSSICGTTANWHHCHPRTQNPLDVYQSEPVYEERIDSSFYPTMFPEWWLKLTSFSVAKPFLWCCCHSAAVPRYMYGSPVWLLNPKGTS